MICHDLPQRKIYRGMDIALSPLPKSYINNGSYPMLQRLFSNNKKMSGYTILVIEDDTPIREAITDNLQAEGYVVVSAVNGEEALRVLDEMPLPAVMIVDLMMP